MKKILISWEASNNDYTWSPDKIKRTGINKSGTHSAFFAEEMSYNKHYLLSSSSEKSAGIHFTHLKQHIESLGIEVIPVFTDIKDVVNVTRITNHVKILLLRIAKQNPNSTFDVFVSPGTPAMQTAWFILALSLSNHIELNLFFVRPPWLREKEAPLKEYVELESIPEIANLTVLEEGFKSRRNSRKNSDFIHPESLQQVYSLADKIALTDDVSALLLGESGTGKEVLARYIHNNSSRSNKPFVAVNCSAFQNADLLESRLFGHEKGMFTGANSSKEGEFHFANGGTIFLDEIGDMPIGMQQTLLRVLNDKRIRKLGGEKEIKIDVRVIAATNVDLIHLVQKGKFRLDLYYRLSVAELQLPSFKSFSFNEKKEVFAFFQKKMSKDFSKTELVFSSEAKRIIYTHSFPGNFREINNLFTRLYVFSDDEVKRGDLPKSILNEHIPSNSLKLRDVEAKHIQKVLNMYPNNKKLVYQTLGITYNTLKKKTIKYQLKNP